MSDNRSPADSPLLSWSQAARRGPAEDAFSRLARAKAEIAALRRELEARDALLARLVGASASPENLAAALCQGEQPQIRATLRTVSILMTDLRGFASLCERLPPVETLDLLNRYTATMGAVVARYGGVVQDVHGDALVTVFNAYDERPDPLDRSVACAIAMQNALEDMNAAHRAEGLPMLEMGVGVHVGEVALGGVGATGWVRPTVVGRHANLASRIESFAAGGQVLVSDAVAGPLGARLRVRNSFPATPKGFDEPVTVFDVEGLAGPYAVDLVSPSDALVDLAEPVHVTLQIVDGKQVVGPLLEGRIERLSPRRAELHLNRPLRPLTDVRINLFPELPGVALYAKSLPGAPEGRVLFRFTSLPPVARDRVDQLRGQSAARLG